VEVVAAAVPVVAVTATDAAREGIWHVIAAWRTPVTATAAINVGRPVTCREIVRRVVAVASSAMAAMNTATYGASAPMVAVEGAVAANSVMDATNTAIYEASVPMVGVEVVAVVSNAMAAMNTGTSEASAPMEAAVVAVTPAITAGAPVI